MSRAIYLGKDPKKDIILMNGLKKVGFEIIKVNSLDEISSYHPAQFQAVVLPQSITNSGLDFSGIHKADVLKSKHPNLYTIIYSDPRTEASPENSQVLYDSIINAKIDLYFGFMDSSTTNLRKLWNQGLKKKTGKIRKSIRESMPI